jgi:phage gp29-like protein
MAEPYILSKAVTSGLGEVGRSGLQINTGIVNEEFLIQLRGVQGRKILREMADNDPIIGGAIMAFIEVLSSFEWTIEAPEEATPQETEAADFTEECRTDMSDDWSTTLAAIMSMAPFGWSYHEIVYKRRQGPSDKPSQNSQYTDGRIGWRKWAPRSQASLDSWEIDDEGGIQGMKQRTETGIVLIPIEKSLLFRIRAGNNNPEGRPLIRNAYRPWFFKKRIEEIEAIGIERDLAGLPVIHVPVSYLSPNATQAEKAVVNLMQTMVTNIKRNEVEGVVFPRAYDSDKNSMFELELLSTGGSRQFDTDKIIARYNQQIAMSVLADFLMLGHEAVGSKSLGVSKIDLWMEAVKSIGKAICAVVNTHAIPRLLRLNGIMVERMPKLTFAAGDNTDLSALGGFIKSLVDAGILIPDRGLEDHVRDLADLPPVDDEERDTMFEADEDPYRPAPPPQLDPNNQDPAAAKDGKLPAAPAGDKLPKVPGTTPKTKPKEPAGGAPAA